MKGGVRGEGEEEGMELYVCVGVYVGGTYVCVCV